MFNYLKTGYAILCHNKGIQSSIIQWTLKSKWNHLVVVVIIDGVTYVTEAMIGQPITLIPYDVWYKEDREMLVLEHELTVHEVLNSCGIKYDLLACLHHLIYRVTGKWIGKIGDNGRLYCFEDYAKKLGLSNYYMVGPNDLINI